MVLSTSLLIIALLAAISCIVLASYIWIKGEYYTWQLVAVIISFFSSVLSWIIYFVQPYKQRLEGLVGLLTITGGVIILVTVVFTMLILGLELKVTIKKWQKKKAITVK